MIQTKIENRKNQAPFSITKEKNIHLLTQRAVKTKKPNNSLNNFNIIKLISCINLDSNRKNENIELSREETNSSSSMEPGVKFSVGRWTKEEHKNFLKGMKEYGNDWKMVQKIIKTRSRFQIRSHAQKYFMRLKKKVKNSYMKFNAINLINYVFNNIKKFNGGQPVTVNQRKRALNVIISNFRNFGKDEIESCNMVVKESKIMSSQNKGDKSTFFEKEYNKNITSKKNNIIIEINSVKNDDNIEDKNNVQENKMEFCNKKRKNTSPINKIFQINKVIKHKYSNNFNKINENSNKQNFENLKKSKIKKSKKKIESKNKFIQNIICPVISESYNINNNTNNFNNLICNISINNDMSNINNNFNNKGNMNSFTNNNFEANNGNINDFTNLDMNKFNFSESIFDFCSKIKKINSFDKFPDGADFNDSLENIFIEESNIPIGEEDNDFPIIFG